MIDLAANSTLVAVISIAFGLLHGFFGYRIFRVLLGAYGLIAGAVAGALLAGNLTGGEIVWAIVGAVAGGLVGATLFVVLYFAGVFLVGAAGGASLATFVGGVAGMEMPLPVVVIVAIVVGIIALILQRAALIVATAFAGAWLAVTGTSVLMTGTVPALVSLFERMAQGEAGAYAWIVLGGWLLLGMLGALVQFVTTREGQQEDEIITRTEMGVDLEES